MDRLQSRSSKRKDTAERVKFVSFPPDTKAGVGQLTAPLDTGGFFSGGPSNSRNGDGSGKRFLWSLDFYAQFFDVDTNEVMRRCWAALFPRANFLDVLEGNPDLYGRRSPGGRRLNYNGGNS